MIVLHYSPWGGPYPWGWRVYLADGAFWFGAGAANRFATPREACRKAQRFILKNPDKLGTA